MANQDIEKSKDQKPERDSLSGIMMGVMFIAAGVLFYLYEQRIIFDWVWWLIFAIGAVLLIESFIRLTVDRFRKPVTANVIWGVILIGFASTQIYRVDDWWPLILIAVGVGFIINSLKNDSSS